MRLVRCSMTSLTVIIVTATSGAGLTKCLLSLSTQSFTDFDIIVVCNGCIAPGKLATAFMERLANRIRFVITSNHGYGAACNLGARRSESPHLVFLNDDTELHPHCLGMLHESLSRSENTIFQPLIFHEYTGMMQRGNPCDIYGAAGLGFYGNCGNGNFYISGASFALSRIVFDSLGGFDEKLFLYHDDLDLSWRARLMGYGIGCSESAICKHAGGASSKKMPHSFKFYLTQRNRVRVMIRNYSTRRMLTRVAVACVMIITGGAFLALTTCKAQYIISTVKAMGWNLLELKGTLIERYGIQAKRVREDEAIEASMSRFSMDLCVLKQRIIGTEKSEKLDVPHLR